MIADYEAEAALEDDAILRRAFQDAQPDPRPTRSTTPVRLVRERSPPGLSTGGEESQRTMGSPHHYVMRRARSGQGHHRCTLVSGPRTSNLALVSKRLPSMHQIALHITKP